MNPSDLHNGRKGPLSQMCSGQRPPDVQDQKRHGGVGHLTDASQSRASSNRSSVIR